MATPYVNTPVAPAQSETDHDINVGTGNDDTWDDRRVRFTIMDTFGHSGLHPLERLTKDVFAVAQVEVPGSEPVTIFARNAKTSPRATKYKIHAEENLIVKLSAFLLRLRDAPGGGIERIVTGVTVTIWINYSPCFECSPRLEDFIHEMRNKNVHMSMEIVFPHPYRIPLPTELHNCQHDLNLKTLRGLLRLKSLGVFLKTFDEEEWRRLGEVLGINYTFPENRTHDDDNTRQAFQNVMTNDIASIDRLIAAFSQAN